MPVTQREMDITELESQLRMQRLFEEWKIGFLGDRIPQEVKEEIDGTRRPGQTATNPTS